MCPNNAFHDQNFFPHSLHGRVIFGAPGSGFFLYFGFPTPVLEPVDVSSILISFVRFFLGFCRGFSGTTATSRDGGEGENRRPESVVVVVVMVVIISEQFLRRKGEEKKK